VTNLTIKERPILFNSEMVKAILEDRKTQTRRPIKLNAAGRVELKGKNWHIEDSDAVLACPLGKVGHRLWVRETFAHSNFPYGPLDRDCVIYYRADYLDDPHGPDGEKSAEGKYRTWSPSLHMPRWASRITLEITGVRIERLHRIAEQDAKNEGADCLITKNCTASDRDLLGDVLGMPIFDDLHPYKNGFALIWESIYRNWNANPLVWVVEFKRLDNVHQ